MLYQDPHCKWINIHSPTKENLESLTHEYDLHWTSIQDCLDPEHLPKVEQFEKSTFLILRFFDLKSPEDANNVQELTNKLSIFIGPHWILTIHHYAEDILQQAKYKIGQLPTHQKITPDRILVALTHAVLHTYEKPLEDYLQILEEHESVLFNGKRGRIIALQDIHLLKRKASVLKRLLRLSIETISKLGNKLNVSTATTQDLKETAEGLFFYTEELQENCQNLIHLSISLTSQKTNEATHKTNEVMRLLTVFSMFILPLNFIASIYGMNFMYIPELQLKYGYHLALGIMLLISIFIYLWFRKKGWLKP